MHVRPAPTPSPSRLRLRFALVCALCIACAAPPPAVMLALSAAVVDWSSIVLAAFPYVAGGALAAELSRRAFDRPASRGASVVALLAMLNPGCDCALNGIAAALSRARPALAGFALTCAAAASPVALAVTHAAFGARMTIARAAGAILAAALTALAWHWIPAAIAGEREHCVSPRTDTAAGLGTALGGVAWAATAAVVCKAIAPAGVANMAPLGAALLGALLSPCSTADPLLAATLLRNSHAQFAFMLASQCLDVRQGLLLLRNFGPVRAAAAYACAAFACACVTTFV